MNWQCDFYVDEICLFIPCSIVIDSIFFLAVVDIIDCYYCYRDVIVSVFVDVVVVGFGSQSLFL